MANNRETEKIRGHKLNHLRQTLRGERDVAEVLVDLLVLSVARVVVQVTPRDFQEPARQVLHIVVTVCALDADHGTHAACMRLFGMVGIHFLSGCSRSIVFLLHDIVVIVLLFLEGQHRVAVVVGPATVGSTAVVVVLTGRPIISM